MEMGLSDIKMQSEVTEILLKVAEMEYMVTEIRSAEHDIQTTYFKIYRCYTANLNIKVLI